PADSVSSLVAAWVGIGIEVAKKSGASGVRFFRESPALLLSSFRSPHGRNLLPAVHRVVEVEPALALESLKAGSELLNAAVSLEAWVDAGLSLAAREYTLGVEYFRITPALLRFIPVDELSRWVEVGLHLAEGTRYFDTLVFYRLSPELFQQTPELLRPKLLTLLWMIGRDAPAEVVPLFKEAPDLLSQIGRGDRSAGLAEASLEAAIQIASYDGRLAALLLRKTPDILKVLGGLSHRYLDWVSAGMSLLAQDRERAKGYFTLVTREGREALDRLIGGLSLSSVEGILKRFATALGGKPLAIRPLSEGAGGEVDPLPKSDGFVLLLPAHLRLFPTTDENFLWYKAAVAHAAGRVEFGSDTLSREQLDRAGTWLASRHGFQVKADDLSAFFTRFPRPSLVRDLFFLAEGTRVESLLRRNYPGLIKDLDRVAAVTLDRRLPIAGKPPQEAAVELLLQISLAGKTREPIPGALQPILFEACRMLGVVQEAEASVETSLRAACEVYFVLDPQGKGHEFPENIEGERFEERGRGERGEGDGAGDYRPADPLAHRGDVDPEPARRTRRLLKEKTAAFLQKLKEAGADIAVIEAELAVEDAYRSGEIDLDGAQSAESFSNWSEKTAGSLSRKEQSTGKESDLVYPEWDCTIQGYRESWCRLREEEIAEGSEGFARRVREERRGEVLETVRLFQCLKPQAYWKTRGEEEGEEIDLDALIGEIAARRAGQSPKMRVFARRNRKERSVAAAVLVDLSGSTQRQVSPGRSVLDVEKEGLVLLAEALSVIGDPSAFYGFSGQGKDRVVVYRIKGFEERWDVLAGRIGSLNSVHQNRDGAAIRHATSRLAQRSEKTKLLILISDGRPLDESYDGSYALQDTRRSLQEAKAKGIHPFCITIDREGPDYLEGMYGEVAYMVVDDVSSLPRMLPMIYRKLTT
ncbi:MAG TPA: VWA domain-containing protein, partial [Nitrospiria bacterium]|nr:VWA domain-containing protein [Nitrospiria bacterium]